MWGYENSEEKYFENFKKLFVYIIGIFIKFYDFCGPHCGGSKLRGFKVKYLKQ